mmetsp:Transcript_2327/g.9075  ORF Transcript_2327/g.9075 Transcript_2327/m.9075 type:complete len:560 (+) Transcript_2327:669-2348(+)
MVRLAPQVILPVALPPELEPKSLLPAGAERRVPVRRALQVEVPQLCQVCPDDLIGVHIDDLVQVEREEDVEEEDLVAPNDALLLGLAAQPVGPLVRDHLDLKPGRLGEGGDGLLELGAEEVLDKPEGDGAGRPLRDGQHHDLEEPLVQVPRRQREDVDAVVLPGDSCRARRGLAAKERPHRAPEAPGGLLACLQSHFGRLLLFLHEQLCRFEPWSAAHPQLRHVAHKVANRDLEGGHALHLGLVVVGLFADQSLLVLPDVAEDPAAGLARQAAVTTGALRDDNVVQLRGPAGGERQRADAGLRLELEVSQVLHHERVGHGAQEVRGRREHGRGASCGRGWQAGGRAQLQLKAVGGRAGPELVALPCHQERTQAVAHGKALAARQLDVVGVHGAGVRLHDPRLGRVHLRREQERREAIERGRVRRAGPHPGPREPVKGGEGKLAVRVLPGAAHVRAGVEVHAHASAHGVAEQLKQRRCALSRLGHRVKQRLHLHAGRLGRASEHRGREGQEGRQRRIEGLVRKAMANASCAVRANCGRSSGDERRRELCRRVVGLDRPGP